MSAKNTEIHFTNSFYDYDTSALINPIETLNFEIVQSVDSHYSNRLTIHRHNQLCDIEFTYVSFGTLYLRANQYNSTALKNQSHICFLNETHKLYSNRACRFQNIAFNVKQNSPYYLLLENLRSLYNENRIIPQNARIGQIMNSILLEFTHLDPQSPLYFDSLIGQLIIEISRPSHQNIHNHQNIVQYDIPLAVIHYIDRQYMTIVTVEELATVFNLSYNAIFKKFKDTYGISPKEYLVFKRMERAANLLKEGNLTINQISETFGYISPHNFSRAFFNYIGKYPTEYSKDPFPILSPFEK